MNIEGLISDFQVKKEFLPCNFMDNLQYIIVSKCFSIGFNQTEINKFVAVLEFFLSVIEDSIPFFFAKIFHVHTLNFLKLRT